MDKLSTVDPITLTDAWEAYLEIRKEKQRIAPFTPLAKKRILAKLRMFAADGQNIEEVLWLSVENGWTGIFEIKRKGWQPAPLAITVPSKQVNATQSLLNDQAAHAALVEKQRIERLRARETWGGLPT